MGADSDEDRKTAPTARMEKPLSLRPLSFEEAVERILKSPPPKHSTAKKPKVKPSH